MFDELSRLLAVNGYLPHGYCISWSPPLLWTFVISDILIFFAYFSMPVALVHFARQRRDFPYRWLLWMFAAFIMACGASHLMGAIVLWQPMYALEALLKAITAVISVITAIALWPLIPHAMKLPSPDQMKKANAELEREIEERKRIEEVLKVATERAVESLQKERLNLAAIVESSDVAIIGKSLDGNITSWNKAAEDLFGYSAKEIVGQSVVTIIPPERREEETDVLATVLRGESVKHFDTVRLRKDGSRIDVAITVSPIKDKEGRISGASKIVRDITERKRYEDQLRKLSMVVEQSPERIVITNRNAEIEYVNAAFIENTGYTREEAIGQNPRILQSGRTPLETYAALWKALSNGQVWKGELYNQRKDGSEYVEFAIITPIRQPDGTTTHYAAVKADITEKKLLNEELEAHRNHLESLVNQRTIELTAAQQRAEAANIAKSAFLANMSHEIRTPMNGIIGMAHLLRREGVTPKQVNRLDTIDASAQHLLAIINDVLDISKIEAGKFLLEEAPVVVNSLLANVASILSERARAKGLHLLIESEHLPHNLVGDPMRLQQALLNYVSNAIKFTEAGSVTLRAHKLAETSEELKLRFEVRDSGIGIAPEAMSRLFTAFEQADSSMTRKYGGTGLGLVITKRLAEMMGGEAGAESTPRLGSTFWFTATLKRMKERRDSNRPEQEGTVDAETLVEQRHQGKHILVVDDEPVNREVAQLNLEAVGLVVATAEDGADAVAMAQDKAYAAIFMDMQMPNINGLEATRQIRKLPGYSDTPIIAMTANAFAEDKARCFDAGMTDFLVKPFDPDTLFATLLRSLSRRDG